MQSLRFLPAVLCLTFLAGLGGCASSGSASDDEDQAAVQKAWNDPKNHIRPASNAAADDPSSEMKVDGEEGTFNAGEVEEAIQQHRVELLDCYRLGRRSSQRGYGRALIRFFVDGKGEVYDVAILESTVGNPRVERCLADIAIGVNLPPPNGRKPTTFDYPIEFTARPLTAERQKRH